VSGPDLRRAAAACALDLVEPGMRLGLGTGSTAAAFVALLGERVRNGLDIVGVPTSEATRVQAEGLGIRLATLDTMPELDLTIDGADEVDDQLRLIKGGGAALLREKIVVTAADRFVVVAEARKRVTRLGESFRLPVEVVRFGWRDTRRRLLDLLPSADPRVSLDAMVLTDEGHYLLDCALPKEGDLRALGDAIKATVGVVEHGLFLGLASEALLGTPDGELEVLTSPNL
jgi:ribose 5-phosphate isomerase A